jgi:hypothetical protein
MYNPATQVQVPTDVNLGSYFQKIKLAVGASPTAFPFKKNYPFKECVLQKLFFQDTFKVIINHSIEP